MSTRKRYGTNAPALGRATERKPRAPVAGVKEKARSNCRHCNAADCTVHCQATKNGQHQVEFGDMQVEDSGPAVVVVEIFCARCRDRANAVIVESAFTWEGQWREEPRPRGRARTQRVPRSPRP